MEKNMSELNIPDSWAAVKFGDVFEVRRGASPRPVGDPKYFGNGKVGWLRIADVTREGKIINSTVDTLTDEGVKKSVYINPGEIILSNSGTVGLPCFAGIPLCVHDGFLVFPNAPKEVFSEFLYWFFLSFRTEISKQAKVGTQANLNTEIVRGVDFCLPPYKEQERIVQKIEACFSKIEETEQNLNKVEILLEKYRESLLVKAFRGELIPQNPDDEPASVLLGKIREERAQNQKDKKKEQEFSPVSDEEKPFDIPESWEWVRLGELLEFRRGHNPPKSEFKYEPRKGYIRFVQIQDFKREDKAVYVPDTEKLKKCVKGDIMVCAYRHIGKYSREMEGAFNVALCHFMPRKGINSDFIELLLPTSFIKGALLAVSERSMIPSMSVEVAAQLVVPLPPQSPQLELLKLMKASYEKFEELMKDLKFKKKMISKLKEAVLLKAFEGRLVEQIKSEGTGHELLQKILDQKNQAVSAKVSLKKKVAKKVSKKKITKK
jgi:type I restriction enzyme, S subunit